MKAKITFDKFQEFKTLIEKQTGSHIRALRSDNGGEFDSHHFKDLCREARIKREPNSSLQPPAERGC